MLQKAYILSIITEQKSFTHVWNAKHQNLPEYFPSSEPKQSGFQQILVILVTQTSARAHWRRSLQIPSFTLHIWGETHSAEGNSVCVCVLLGSFAYLLRAARSRSSHDATRAQTQCRVIRAHFLNFITPSINNNIIIFFFLSITVLFCRTNIDIFLNQHLAPGEITSKCKTIKQNEDIK